MVLYQWWLEAWDAGEDVYAFPVMPAGVTIWAFSMLVELCPRCVGSHVCLRLWVQVGVQHRQWGLCDGTGCLGRSCMCPTKMEGVVLSYGRMVEGMRRVVGGMQNSD